MRILKIILFAILGIIALLLVIALFVKKEYAVERQITINEPKTEVFDYVKFLRNQDNFSKWATMDPAMKKDFRGTDGEVGFVSAWDSEMQSVGKGEQEITGIDEGNRIDFELRFMEPFEATDNAYMVTESVNDSVTNVKWGFDGKMKYPMNLMLLFMDMEGMLGGDLEQGLTNLKGVLENQ